MDLKGTGIEPVVLGRFIEEQIYSLPGTDRRREVFTVLLTGSRAVGAHRPGSDVDVDVLCGREVYQSVQAASLAAGLIDSRDSFFFVLPGDDWHRYYGKGVGRPHFAMVPLEDAEKHIADYDDVWLWIWTNARVLHDPGRQFQRIREGFDGYPRDVLVRKIKYHWLLSAFWQIDAYPHHQPEELLAAGTAMLNGVNELLKVFFLVEGKPFPYVEKLMRYAERTKLGGQLGPILHKVVDLVVGADGSGLSPWQRLEKAFQTLCCSETSAECRRLEQACAKAMIDAGVDPKWVETDYNNIDELLLGKLGPAP